MDSYLGEIGVFLSWLKRIERASKSREVNILIGTKQLTKALFETKKVIDNKVVVCPNCSLINQASAIER